MTALLIGYARCSTDQQDLTAQHDGLITLGVSPTRIYVDHGLTGTNRDRPGLREALAACREGDTLVVTKLDRLARSLLFDAVELSGIPVDGQEQRSHVGSRHTSRAAHRLRVGPMLLALPTPNPTYRMARGRSPALSA